TYPAPSLLPADKLASGLLRAVSLQLFPAEFLGVAIKHKPFTRDQRNLQHGSRAFKFGLRHAINESIAFEHRAPHGREIISLSHDFGAQPRPIVCSLSGHN